MFRQLLGFFILAACISTSANAANSIKEIRVLTYNVQGLPWPLKKDKGEWEKIGQILAERRAAGTHPQVVVLQEAFRTKTIKKMIKAAGYKYWVEGPSRSKRSPFDPPPKHCPPKATACSPYEFMPLTNSGSYILSDFPILKSGWVPFGYRACAGLDCFANKAVVYAEIQVPGHADSLHVFTTHMNSSKSSGVSKEKYVASRARQIEIMDWFMKKKLPNRAGHSIVVLGDFNMAPKKEPYDKLVDTLQMPNAQEECLRKTNGCMVLSKESEDEIFYNTPDHQFYQSGSLHLQPKIMEHTFYETVDGTRPVSDHLGIEIVYDIL